jgi:regulator of sirC expression with transglutaminase-like and TPR domain
MIFDLSEARKSSLTKLLDDDSEVVRKAVMEEICKYGPEGIDFLRKLTDTQNRVLAGHARDYLELLGKQDTLTTFSDFIRSFHYELETGCILLDRTLYPDLETSKVCLFIDKMAARCREIMVMPSSQVERCKVLNRVIFHEFGFRGDVENYYDPENSFLSRVIDRRRGIPITLSILYILVGQRCNLQLEPVGVPGRFMVGCFEGVEPFYIDAFERGHFRTTEDVERLVENHYGEKGSGFLSPTPVGEVLCRCCRNLVNQYSAHNDQKRARLYTSFVNEFEATYRKQAQS